MRRQDSDVPKGWCIYDPKSGSYYAGPSGIGPRFGASRKTAHVFLTALETVSAMGHIAFSGCCLETPDGKWHSEVPETVRGKAAQEGVE